MKFPGIVFGMLAIASTAMAEPVALAPWFDADGFYNKPGVTLEDATNDFAGCRLEALRLKAVKSGRTAINGNTMAFNPDGSYNPVVSGAATGIASILFAIQDSSYNGGIERKEFRDCIASAGYGNFDLPESSRAKYDAMPDRGLAELVAAQTPTEGRQSRDRTFANYYKADLVVKGYEAPKVEAPIAILDQNVPAPSPISDTPPTALDLKRIPSRSVAQAADGMAIVVISARQAQGSQGFGGALFYFRQTPESGDFTDLLKPSPTLSVWGHQNSKKKEDPAFGGKSTDAMYSTFSIPAGRYALSQAGLLSTCLGTFTFSVAPGQIAYLGDWVFLPAGMPIAPLINPFANIKASFDDKLKSDMRIAVGDAFEDARSAIQASEEDRAKLVHVELQNDYRLPCATKDVGRVHNEAWRSFGSEQNKRFVAAMIESANAAVATSK